MWYSIKNSFIEKYQYCVIFSVFVYYTKFLYVYILYNYYIVTIKLRYDQIISDVCKPTVAVGVVGIGHTPGIKELWMKVSDEDVQPILV